MRKVVKQLFDKKGCTFTSNTHTNIKDDFNFITSRSYKVIGNKNVERNEIQHGEKEKIKGDI